ncbi:hypothetical protein BKA70DRAFT_1427956 [Coprinopsis sp. MPI-PUGE-AT-0042]|nr:hypothetical protein BKA70DRAFT_1427956 [Coprinopsis sp. MPI-PUGE-AT-0042]
MLIDFPVSLSLLLSLSVAVTGNPIDDNETVAGLATEDATPRIYHGLDEVCRDPNEPPPPPPPPPPSSVPLPAPPPSSTTRAPPPPPSTSGTTRPAAIPSSPTRTTTVIVVTTPVGSSSPPFNPDTDFPSVQSTDDRVVQTTIRPGDIDPNEAPGIQAGGEESISKGHVIIPQGRLYPVLFCFFYLLL